jgi:hypothetical protein
MNILDIAPMDDKLVTFSQCTVGDDSIGSDNNQITIIINVTKVKEVQSQENKRKEDESSTTIIKQIRKECKTRYLATLDWDTISNS